MQQWYFGDHQARGKNTPWKGKKSGNSSLNLPSAPYKEIRKFAGVRRGRLFLVVVCCATQAPQPLCYLFVLLYLFYLSGWLGKKWEKHLSYGMCGGAGKCWEMRFAFGQRVKGDVEMRGENNKKKEMGWEWEVHIEVMQRKMTNEKQQNRFPFIFSSSPYLLHASNTFCSPHLEH